MFGMANLQPGETGLDFIVHVYKDEHRYSAKHGPRVKVFPGKPHQGNPTAIIIPLTKTNEPELVGKATIPGAALREAMAFVSRNRYTLALYWYVADFTEDDLREQLK